MVRGQAAMEFVMTYGWAILAVLVAISALAYFGVLSPKDGQESCMVKTGFGCKEYSVVSSASATQMKMVLGNSVGGSIKINSATAEIAGQEVACTSSSGSIDSGDNFMITCDAPVPVESDAVKVHVKVKYTKSDGAYEQTMDGDIITHVQKTDNELGVVVIDQECLPAQCATIFGTCTVFGISTCSGGVYGPCIAVDPREATCGEQCGISDGCGGTCACDPTTLPYCNPTTNRCELKCIPQCDGTTCGDDKCGGTCTCTEKLHVCNPINQQCEILLIGPPTECVESGDSCKSDADCPGVAYGEACLTLDPAGDGPCSCSCGGIIEKGVMLPGQDIISMPQYPCGGATK